MAAQKKKAASRAPEQAVTLQKVLGQIVLARRRELGIAQGDLAANLGVSPATASKIETGRQDVSLDQLWRLASLLNLPASELLKRVEVAVDTLQRNNVRMVRPKQAVSNELTAAALGGLLVFLLSQRD